MSTGQTAQGSGGTAVRVGKVADFDEGQRRFVMIAGREVGVLQWQGEFFAFENRCIHQGGPVCEGVVIGRVETTVDDQGRATGQVFNDEQPHLVCPWHGVEYELRTGICVVDPRRRIRKYNVEVQGEDIYVAV